MNKNEWIKFCLGCTTHKLSYYPNDFQGLIKSKSFKPPTDNRYRPPDVPFEEGTTMRLSYQPVDCLPREKPWAQRIEYHPPLTLMEDNTIYNQRCFFTTITIIRFIIIIQSYSYCNKVINCSIILFYLFFFCWKNNVLKMNWTFSYIPPGTLEALPCDQPCPQLLSDMGQGKI